MIKCILLVGALLGGAPLLSQVRSVAEPDVVDGEVVWFRLTETQAEVARAVGLPHLAADFGADLRSWQYRDPGAEHDEFSRALVFRRSTGVLIAVTRTYPEERVVDWLFPEVETESYCNRAGTAPAYCVRLRRLSGGRLLIANGTPAQLASQILLIREAELAVFYPWLAEKLRAATPRAQLRGDRH